MAASRPSTFVRAALASGLVTSEQLERAVQSVRASGGLNSLPAIGVGDERLAGMLIDQGILTTYQAQQLKEGRSKLNLGPYVITDWLGQGGMGQVFVARHQMMDRLVAIKVLPRSKSTPEAIASFTREIQTQAKLDHRNLVRAYDAGHDGNVYFLVTEYVPGTDLRKLVPSQGRFTMAQSASVIQQAAIGLGYAHSQGLVHRDMKPGNLLVTPEGLVKVSDLGLAGFLHEGPNDPRAGKIVGTADYLAPEKITTPHSISAVSDIYALGCTLYYAVTGKVPFPGGSTRDKARRHCEETPWHPRQFNPDVSDEFVDLIADMMEKDPQRRIQTADEVVQRLRTWIDQTTVIPQPAHHESPGLAPPVPVPGRDDTMDDWTSVDFTDSSPVNAASPGISGVRPAASATPLPPMQGSGNALKNMANSPDRAANALPTIEQQRTRKAVLRALSLAIPVSLIAGGLLTWLLIAFLQS